MMIPQDLPYFPRKIGLFASELQLPVQAFTATANEKTQRSTAFFGGGVGVVGGIYWDFIGI